MTRSSKAAIWAICGTMAFAMPGRADNNLLSCADIPTTQKVSNQEPLTNNVLKGLEWLIKNQTESGGWGQGDESQAMRGGDQKISGAPNVADTCAAVLAIMRTGSSPMEGKYAKNVRHGVEFICDSVEKADSESLFVTDVRNTRLQMKLGQYVDTFLAALTLAEVKGKMGDAETNARVEASLKKTLGKMDKNQQKDGGWANGGWAPALAQGIASKAANRAEQEGISEGYLIRKKTEQYAKDQFNGGTISLSGSAGVELYSRSSSLVALNDSDVSNASRENQLAQVVSSPTTQPEAKAAAQKELDGILDTRQQLHAATRAVVDRMNDKRFVEGFGSNGGEEFLSYVNIGEALAAKGGDEFDKWDKGMTENLTRIQDDDGSWSGQHCITGKTFCTSAALMVLTVDRAGITPLGGKIKKS